MKESEIVHLLKVWDKSVNKAIKAAAEYTPSIKSKFVDGKLWFGTEFNLEETKIIFKELHRNELELILLEENWKEVPEKDIYTIKGTLEYLKKFEENPFIKCCNTCKYLKGLVTTTIMPRPYCSLYEKFLYSMPANVYEDYCSSYTYVKLPKARQWYKDNAPSNLNQYGETDTVNGVERSKLNYQRKREEPIRLVNQVGFDSSESTT
jgi:hypothetical protein